MKASKRLVKHWVVLMVSWWHNNKKDKLGTTFHIRPVNPETKLPRKMLMAITEK